MSHSLQCPHHRKKVERWLTFNEAAFYTLAETAYRPLDAAGTAAMTKNLIAAHRGAYDAIHRFNRDAQVSSNIAWQQNRARAIDGDAFIQGVKDKLDPFGMYVALRALHSAFPKLPVMVTENGMPLENAEPRADGSRAARTSPTTCTGCSAPATPACR